MRSLRDWLDDRTGYRAIVHEALYERIPGGSRWRYVWGSTLVFAFFTQAITGLFLWMVYSPSAQTAWESVYFIQYEVQGGWFLRGLHHFMAQAMVVLLALHLLQVVIDGAYRAPREVNFWIGLILMLIVLGLSLTGYLLPWDQKGYWATKVATNLMGVVPGVGVALQRLAVGGSAYGHQTLTRFFALHAGLLPGLLILFLAAHVYVFRRHGIHARAMERPDSTFWPDQVLKDAVACLAVLAVVMFLVAWNHGAHLGAPADPANPYAAARPEWYFLFLFQFLKYFHGETEVYGAVVSPSVALVILFLMPIVGRWKLGHGFNIAYLVALLMGVGVLTAAALRADRQNPDYQVAVVEAEQDAIRAVQLAQSATGIPP
jgi:quinol-cytochrome oxidoreductase complex cytochrome b subunit